MTSTSVRPPVGGAPTLGGMGAVWVRQELRKCILDPVYFVDTYCLLKDEVEGAWTPFHLWPFQAALVDDLAGGGHLAVLKARQLGITWLVLLGRILHRCLFAPITTALVFSRRDLEAIDLLRRLKDAFRRLPDWMRGVAGGVLQDNDHAWILGNGSAVRAFPTSAGDSYTASIAFCDEFDLVENQAELLTAVKPTIDAGGQMILVSRADKDRPLSSFKGIYRQAREGLEGWKAIFIPWFARPDRNPKWYALRREESLAVDNTLDGLWEQYPATDVEALAQRQGNKRLPAEWLLACYQKGVPVKVGAAPALPGLRIYTPPVVGSDYLLGVDPAEGNPTSDESAACVVTKDTGQEVAILAGRFQPPEFASFCLQLATFYHAAECLPERNNHGHAFIQAYVAPAGAGPLCTAAAEHLLLGTDGRPGWLTTGPSKALAYDNAARCLQEGDAGIQDLETFTQLGSIEGTSLSAPEGQHDDRAMAWVLAQKARAMHRKSRKLVTW